LAAELAFDAIEVENATPGFYVFNRLARRLNMGLGAAELGCSDAHIVDAVGRAFTEFPGKTPADLRKAIEAAQTRAGRRRYRAVGLMRYAAWGLNHQRYVVAVCVRVPSGCDATAGRPLEGSAATGTARGTASASAGRGPAAW